MRLALGARALLVLAGVAAGGVEAADAPSPSPLVQQIEREASAELRLHWDARSINDAGPLAAANRWSPGIAPATPSALVAEAELRGVWRAPNLPFMRSSVVGNGLLWAERPEGSAARSQGRINELYAAGDFGAWQASAGKKVVGWDVGFGFRPNDVVQQEARRTLLAFTPEGRALVELEHYGAETAGSLVWVNPQHAHTASDDQRGALETAVATRLYRRDGSADWHAFGRWGEHTAGSLGAALAWVATDELELHASVRALQRHDGWQLEPQAGTALVTNNPWHQATLGHAAQALLGASWTGRHQQSLLIEAWHDGTALADRDWDAWLARNRALGAFGAQSGLPAGLLIATSGNLAWQATPFAATNLRRDNLFMRMAWQPDRWTLSLDVLFTPSDRGHVLTAAAQWQGERLRLNAAWRVYGGPADALFAQLPQRSVGLLAAVWPF